MGLASGFTYTKLVLHRWGSWARGGLIGFPRMSALCRINSGGKLTADGLDDPTVVQCDQVIAKAESGTRIILVRHYCGYSSGRENAARLNMAKSTYYDKLDEARWYVHTELETGLKPPDRSGIDNPILGALPRLVA